MEDFDYSSLTLKDAEEYVSQMPYPLKGLLKVKTPVKLKNGQWRNFCGCQKEGVDKDGETYCSNELTEIEQYDIVEHFWDCFLKGDLHTFIEWAIQKTGREILFAPDDYRRVYQHYVSLLMFFTLPRCYLALRWCNFIHYVSSKNTGQGTVYPGEVFLPICLTDSHLVFKVGESQRPCSRLVKKTNDAMLCKLHYNLREYPNKEDRVFGLTIADHERQVKSFIETLKVLTPLANPYSERSYVAKFHYCKQFEGEVAKDELCVVTMCDSCKGNGEMVVPLKDCAINTFTKM